MGAQVVERLEQIEQLTPGKGENSLDLNARLAVAALETAAPLSLEKLQTKIPSDYSATVAKEIATEISIQLGDALKGELTKNKSDKQVPFNEQHALAELGKLGIEATELKTFDQIKDARLQIDKINQPLIDRIAVTELVGSNAVKGRASQSHVTKSKFSDFQFNPPNLAKTFTYATYGILTSAAAIVSGVAGYISPSSAGVEWGIAMFGVLAAVVLGSSITAPVAMGVGKLLSKWSKVNDLSQARNNYNNLLETHDPIALEVEHAIDAGAQFIDQSISEEARRDKSADIIRGKLISELGKSTEISKILQIQAKFSHRRQEQQAEDAISAGVLTSAAVSGINLSLDQEHSPSRVSASDIAFLEEYLQSISRGIEPKRDEVVPEYLRDSILKLNSLQPEFRQNVAIELLPRISAMRELMAEA